MTILRETTASAIDQGEITFDTRDGELKMRLRPGHRAHGLGAAARLRRGLLRRTEEKDGKKAIRAGTGIEFTSPDRVSYPKLSPLSNPPCPAST